MAEHNPSTSESKDRRPFPKYTVAFGVTLVLTLLVMAGLSQGDNQDIYFEREVPSPVPIETLGQALDSVLAWSQWHHITVDARRMDGMGNPLPLNMQDVTQGAIVRFTIEPRQRSDRRFELTGRVTAYEKGKRVHVEFVSETKPQVVKLFDRLEWEIELIPGTPHGAPELSSDQAAQGTTVRGKLWAHTSTWRARLFARIAKRILMNQVFYPNLTALAELKKPRTFDQAFPESTR